MIQGASSIIDVITMSVILSASFTSIEGSSAAGGTVPSGWNVEPRWTCGCRRPEDPSMLVTLALRMTNA